MDKNRIAFAIRCETLAHTHTHTRECSACVVFFRFLTFLSLVSYVYCLSYVTRRRWIWMKWVSNGVVAAARLCSSRICLYLFIITFFVFISYSVGLWSSSRRALVFLLSIFSVPLVLGESAVFSLYINNGVAWVVSECTCMLEDETVFVRVKTKAKNACFG